MAKYKIRWHGARDGRRGRGAKGWGVYNNERDNWHPGTMHKTKTESERRAAELNKQARNKGK